METLMVDHEDQQSHSVAKTVFGAVADWVNRYRCALMPHNELEGVDADQVAAIAKDLGITTGQLRELANKGDETASLRNLLIALGVDPKELEKIDPRIARDMQWLCINCSRKSECNFDLSIGIAATTFRDICPNALALEEIFDLRK
jgi:hypothetical protein